MLEAFIATFITAIIFTLYSFLTIEEDTKKKSERQIYILLICIVSWPVSLGMLVAPVSSTLITTTTNVPLNCFYNTANTLPSNVPSVSNCGTTTQTSTAILSTNTPFPGWAFIGYMSFSLGITLMQILFLAAFMLKLSAKTMEDGIKDMNS